MNIAIFGGSFDPPHTGHEEIVNSALNTLNIDKLIVVPNFLNPFKNSSFIDAKNRFFLLQKLFKKNKNVEVIDFEISQNRSVYTIETVEYLLKSYKCENIYMIIGTDNLEKLHLWHEYKKLNSLVKFVVASRSGYLNQNYGNITTLDVNVEISSTNLRNNLDLQYIPKEIQNDVKKLWHNKGKKN